MIITQLFSAPLTFILAENMVARWFNVIVFFGLLFFLLRKPTRDFFADRFARLRSSLERAAKEKEEAQARIQAIDARLAQLDSETAKIKETAKAEAAAETERLQLQTQADVEKIRATARREIDAATQTAMIELRQFTAGNAVNLAEKIIRQELTQADDAALLQRASSEIKM